MFSLKLLVTVQKHIDCEVHMFYAAVLWGIFVLGPCACNFCVAGVLGSVMHLK